ncbi:MAG: hypothetical protein RsTaC01_0821 [Candidatus Paraimprobicoccus trichonymphae]|uniref:Uncharacterized protein n=1 Tax=Candidatus Paraimprobicoccus trichonymphae TaxID=3033793 RepID=A0AA48HWX0_9FIRM|nr:MAG: hypothetical protein RsTaC01_0821 [Candidatus Paraimprobicoccus trichonymphae]
MIGKNLALGVGEGFANEMDTVSKFNDKIQKLIVQKDKIETEVQLLVAENANIAQKQEICNEKRNFKVVKFQKLEQKILDLECQKAKQIANQYQIEKFLKKNW